MPNARAGASVGCVERTRPRRASVRPSSPVLRAWCSASSATGPAAIVVRGIGQSTMVGRGRSPRVRRTGRRSGPPSDRPCRQRRLLIDCARGVRTYRIATPIDGVARRLRRDRLRGYVSDLEADACVELIRSEPSSATIPGISAAVRSDAGALAAGGHRSEGHLRFRVLGAGRRSGDRVSQWPACWHRRTRCRQGDHAPCRARSIPSRMRSRPNSNSSP